MNHKGTVKLCTERLILRRFEASDVEIAYKNWTSDREVTKYLTWKAHNSASETQDVISSWINNYNKENFYQWAIELKEIDEVIGTISVVNMNEKVNKVHIGYAIGRKFWNRGIVTEAFKRIIKFLFEEVEVNRIESQFDPNNPASGKVMENCGLKFEGILRDYDYNNQGVVDASMHAILKNEYFIKIK